MRNRVYNLYPSVTSFQQLRDSARLARRGVRLNRSLSFWSELESNVLELRQSLLDKTYRPALYRVYAQRPGLDVFKLPILPIGCSPCPVKVWHPILNALFAHLLVKLGRASLSGSTTQRFSRRFQEGWFLKMDIRHCLRPLTSCCEANKR